ncbi:UDP-glucoronosyl and UDP-glucosyl transferase [Angomonas deanei]|nr:UDP-glucoronosyl and UDP-glucosyl transferase [Angomonas deanei]|eukprot:EPY31542.1 UDP-glucoronosyl and UDP-glucosyl transferase [Angomonas deanei]
MKLDFALVALISGILFLLSLPTQAADLPSVVTVHHEHTNVNSSLVDAFTYTAPAHIVVMSIPLWDHWKPLAAIAEELLRRGNKITYLVEGNNETEMGRWCARLIPSYQQQLANETGSTCVNVLAGSPTTPSVFTSSLFEKMIYRRYFRVLRSFRDLLHALLAHQESTLPHYLKVAREIHAKNRITMFLCDMNTLVCPTVAAALQENTPVVRLQSLSTGLIPRPLVDSVPGRQSFFRRLANIVVRPFSRVVIGPHLVSRINHIRRHYNITTMQGGLYELGGGFDTVLTTAVWGLDTPRPLCPNVHPVGLVTPVAEQTDDWQSRQRERRPYHRAVRSVPSTIEHTVLQFLQQCKGGVILVHLGVVVELPDRLVRVLAKSFLGMPQTCFVWQLSDDQRARVVDPLWSSEAPNTLLTRPWLDTPAAILRHENTVGLLSHCGDTSIQEALEYGVPVLGLPLLPHQQEACQRVSNAKVGIVFSQMWYQLSEKNIMNGLRRLIHDGDEIFRPHLRQLKQVAMHLGGAEEAADIIETRHHNLLLRRGSRLERCDGLGKWTGGDWAAVLFFLILTGLWYCLLDWFFRKQKTQRRQRHPPKAAAAPNTTRIVPLTSYPRERMLLQRPVCTGI